MRIQPTIPVNPYANDPNFEVNRSSIIRYNFDKSKTFIDSAYLNNGNKVVITKTVSKENIVLNKVQKLYNSARELVKTKVKEYTQDKNWGLRD